jgi:hypothetical protein
MKKTCGALVIGLLITTTAYAKEVPVKHKNSCLRVINSAFMMKVLETRKDWRFINHDFSRLVANERDCEFLADLIVVGRESPKATESNVDDNSCASVKQELDQYKNLINRLKSDGMADRCLTRLGYNLDRLS